MLQYGGQRAANRQRRAVERMWPAGASAGGGIAQIKPPRLKRPTIAHRRDLHIAPRLSSLPRLPAHPYLYVAGTLCAEGKLICTERHHPIRKFQSLEDRFRIGQQRLERFVRLL